MLKGPAFSFCHYGIWSLRVLASYYIQIKRGIEVRIPEAPFVRQAQM